MIEQSYGMIALGAAITISSSVMASFLWWLIHAILKNTTELAVLSSKIEGIITDTKSIPKMKEDLNVLYKTMKEPRP